MNPVNGDLQSLLKKITPRGNLYSFMSGILLVDATSEVANETVLNHINDYNNWSGKTIDFYMPGYIAADQYVPSMGTYTVPVSIGGEEYLFVKEQFDNFLNGYEYSFRFNYDGYPILILIDVEKDSYNDYFVKEYSVISLHLFNDIDGLFRVIFNYAADNSRMGKKFKYQVLLGRHVRTLTSYLKSQFGDLATQAFFSGCLNLFISHI